MYPATNIRDRNSWNIQSAKAFLYLNKKLIYNTPIRLFSFKYGLNAFFIQVSLSPTAVVLPVIKFFAPKAVNANHG